MPLSLAHKVAFAVPQKKLSSLSDIFAQHRDAAP
jgi:hypothetical protein